MYDSIYEMVSKAIVMTFENAFAHRRRSPGPVWTSRGKGRGSSVMITWRTADRRNFIMLLHAFICLGCCRARLILGCRHHWLGSNSDARGTKTQSPENANTPLLLRIDGMFRWWLLKLMLTKSGRHPGSIEATSLRTNFDLVWIGRIIGFKRRASKEAFVWGGG